MTVRAVGPCLLGLLVLTGCPRSREPSVDPSVGTAPLRSTVQLAEAITELPSGHPVVDSSTGCRVEVPEGWRAWRVDTDPDLVVRLVRNAPPPLRVEVHRGTSRVPSGAEVFFDRGPYLEDQPGRTVAVWSYHEADGSRLMGVLLQDGSRSVVVEGWIPDDEFEAAKRAFDAIVTSTTFGY
jgi:hypothetical protein